MGKTWRILLLHESIEKTGEHRSVSEYFNPRYLDGRTCKTENCSGYSD